MSATRQLFNLSKLSTTTSSRTTVVATSRRQVLVGVVSNRSFSSNNGQVLAKGDSSTIDFFKFPDANYIVDEEPKIKIPSLPDSWTTLNTLKPSNSAGSSSINSEFKPGEILHVSGQATASKMADVDIMSFFTSGSSSKPEDIKLDDLSSKDKSTLLAIFGGVAAWWIIGDLFSSKTEDER